MAISPYLQRCIDLARMGGIRTAPNPMVGAVLVHGNQIIGEGFHEIFGGPHAEVNAIRSVADPSLLAQSTLYVSLEPCNHFGKTPPCSHLIVASGIPKVVVGCLDPNAQVSGKGIEYLRSHGVEVELCEDAQPFVQLNRAFFVNQRQKRSYVTLKWAQTADGFIGLKNKQNQPQPLSISGTEANAFVHRLRAEHQAILVGAGTALSDNPSLTTRLYPGPDPVRILADRDLSVPGTHRIYAQTGRVIVLNGTRNETEGNVRFLRTIHDLAENPRAVLEQLYAEGIGSILVEGGAKIHSVFLRHQLADEIWMIKSKTKVAGDGVAAPNVPEGFLLSPAFGTEEDEVFHFENKV